MRVLLPTDLSSESKADIQQIIERLDVNIDEIILFHSIEVIHNSSNVSANIDELLIGDRRAELEEFKVSLLASNKKLKQIDGQVYYGSFTTDFRRMVNDTKPDLAIFLEKEKSSLEQFFQKKKSIVMLGEISCPVMLIPKKLELEKLTKISVAVDHKEMLSDKVIADIKKTFGLFDCKFGLFHIDDSSETKEELEVYEKFNAFDDVKVNIVKGEDVLESINKHVADSNANALAVVTHNKGFFEKVFTKSLSKRIIKQDKHVIFIFNNTAK